MFFFTLGKINERKIKSTDNQRSWNIDETTETLNSVCLFCNYHAIASAATATLNSSCDTDNCPYTEHH